MCECIYILYIMLRITLEVLNQITKQKIILRDKYRKESEVIYKDYNL